MTSLVASLATVGLPPEAGMAPPRPVQVGYGASLTDLSAFNQAMSGAAQRLEARPLSAPNAALQAVFRPLEQINTEAADLSRHARAAMEAGPEMSPGQMVMLTVKCQEFMFHSQLTANVANRASDGLQQLFRQQA